MNFTEEIKKEAKQESWQKGQKKGIQKGRQEGRQEGIQKVVLSMLQEKADISFVSKVTGLSKTEIKKLKNGA